MFNELLDLGTFSFTYPARMLGSAVLSLILLSHSIDSRKTSDKYVINIALNILDTSPQLQSSLELDYDRDSYPQYNDHVEPNYGNNNIEPVVDLKALAFLAPVLFAYLKLVLFPTCSVTDCTETTIATSIITTTSVTTSVSITSSTPTVTQTSTTSSTTVTSTSVTLSSPTTTTSTSSSTSVSILTGKLSTSTRAD